MKLKFVHLLINEVFIMMSDNTYENEYCPSAMAHGDSNFNVALTMDNRIDNVEPAQYGYIHNSSYFNALGCLLSEDKEQMEQTSPQLQHSPPPLRQPLQERNTLVQHLQQPSPFSQVPQEMDAPLQPPEQSHMISPGPQEQYVPVQQLRQPRIMSRLPQDRNPSAQQLRHSRIKSQSQQEQNPLAQQLRNSGTMSQAPQEQNPPAHQLRQPRPMSQLPQDQNPPAQQLRHPRTLSQSPQEQHPPAQQPRHPRTLSQAPQEHNPPAQQLRQPRPMSHLPQNRNPPAQQLRHPRTLSQSPQEQNPPAQQLRHPRTLSQAPQEQNPPAQQLRQPRPMSHLPQDRNPSAQQIRHPRTLPQSPQEQNPPMQQLRQPRTMSQSPQQQNPPVQKLGQPRPMSQSPQEQNLPAQQLRQPRPMSQSLQQQNPPHEQLNQQQPSRNPPLLPLPRADPWTQPKQTQFLQNLGKMKTGRSDSGKQPSDNGEASGNLNGNTKKVTRNYRKEWQRQQNIQLRSILTPKNALMVLHELTPEEARSSLYKVQTAVPLPGDASKPHTFCAETNVKGISYKGYGGSKHAARINVAEHVFRELIINRMVKLQRDEGNIGTVADTGSAEERHSGPEQEDLGEEEEEPLPMIQLASFALHKLFAEWEGNGYHVPQLKVPREPGEGCTPPRALPPDAASMHPTALLAHMRADLRWRQLRAPDQHPRNTFLVAFDVDGMTFTGEATKKRDARKNAARAACTHLFGVKFADDLRTGSESHV